jgi:DNA mismatch endonuclease (patch repair protein)
VALTIHERMRRVRQRDTAPELAVRRYLHGLGVRYRVCAPGLPSRPDLVNRRAGWAILVHGCYWHGHRGCALYRLPKTNTRFWREKIAANRARDNRKKRELERLGFTVHVVWQCEIGTPKFRQLGRRLARWAK